MNSDIVLAALNARYYHPSFGLRYLLANMGELKERTTLVEFDLRSSPEEIASKLLAAEPRIIGIGVYIWNTRLVERVVGLLKERRPETIVILGGPEISYETEQQPVAELVDYVIQGEADLAFAELCLKLLAFCPGSSLSKPRVIPSLSRDLTPKVMHEIPRRRPDALRGRDSARNDMPGACSHHFQNGLSSEIEPTSRTIKAAPPDLSRIVLPYNLYTDEDLAHKLVYVETTRGCPFKCDYCLSSLDNKVRRFPLENVLSEIESLINRGATIIKFADRTFNLDIDAAVTVMEYVLQRMKPGLCVHFEMVPANFPEKLRECLRRFPEDSLRLEIGIQTLSEEVSERIGRRQDSDEVREILRFLSAETNALVHADLIAGLPGEDFRSFADGFNRLLSLGPREIQVGILKRLRGTGIARHDSDWDMVYDEKPPYSLLRNSLISASDMRKLNHFARFWEMIANSGRFAETKELLCDTDDPFTAFMDLSDYLFENFGKTHGIPLDNLTERIWRHLVDNCGHSNETAGHALWHDYGQHYNDRLSRRLAIFSRGPRGT